MKYAWGQPNELAYIFDAVGHQNLFLLFDIGHAKVNQMTLGVKIEELRFSY